MKKKEYHSPLMKVSRVKQAEIICSSPVTSKTSTEVYDEGSTDGWY